MELSIETIKQRMSSLGLNKRCGSGESHISRQLIDMNEDISHAIWNAVRSLNGRARVCSAPGSGRYYTLDDRIVPVTEIMKAAGAVKETDSQKKQNEGHKVKAMLPGYAQGAYPQKNVSVSS